MNQQKMGKMMMAVGWLAFLGVFMAYFGYVDNKRDNPNQSPESRQNAQKIVVRLDGTSRGHYVATGRINALSVDFLVDTGATYIAIPLKLAEQLGLKKGRETMVNTANGTSKGWYTTLRTVSIGDIVLRDVKALISPGLHGKTLFGMSALQYLDFKQEGKQLVLTQYR